VKLPDLDRQHLALLGGKQCSLGNKKAAYLFCTKNKNKVSVFIVNPKDLDLQLSGDTTYSVEKPHHLIRLWTENELVYITVQSV